MKNPVWILSQLAPVVVAFSKTVYDGQFWRGQYCVHVWVDSYKDLGEFDEDETDLLVWLGRDLDQSREFHPYCILTIPRNAPTWHAYLMFLRYYANT